jgi:hypothetical protein
MHACNPSTQDTETQNNEFEASLGYTERQTLKKTKHKATKIKYIKN